MSAAARQSKFNNRKGPQAEPARRAPAWTAGARASPTFSPPNSGTPRPSAPSQGTGFPALNGSKTADDRVLQSLAGLTGTTITLLTKTSVHYEGVIASTNAEGDTTGVTLKDVKDLSNPSAPLKESVFIASTNIASWNSGPAEARLTNGITADSFKTDTDISQKAGPPVHERELQAWQPSTSDPTLPTSTPTAATGDDLTFGSGSPAGWDQFAANEKLFGVTASFDESVYTTPLDRSQPGFQEKERKAAKLANEIVSGVTSNPHIAEERGQITGAGEDEEEKYGAVVRGSGAYIPPGARKAAATVVATAATKPEIPSVSVNAPQQSAEPSKTSSPSPTPNATATAAAPTTPADAAFREFVNTEKVRLTQKRQAMVKSDMDKRIAELVKFSQSFKLNKPMPDDLVPILAKDEDKQRAIRDKASKDAASSQARNIGPSSTSSTVLPGARNPPQPAKAGIEPSRKPSAPSGAKTTTPAAPASAQKPGAATMKTTTDGKPRASMVIQAIPPFRGPKSTATAKPANGAAAPPGSDSSKQIPGSPVNNKLNVNASSFRPNPKASAFTPGGSPHPNGTNSASPKPGGKEQAVQGPANPFFGTRQLKKNAPVSVKDDFNPFKHNKVAEASTVSAMWPYNGKRYIQMFPVQQHPPPPQLHSPHMPGVVPGVGVPVPVVSVGGITGQVGVTGGGMQPPPGTVPPPPSYEEDQAQAQARGGYVYYPPYGYPQHMMQGMPPPGPPGFIPAQYMQPVPYPPGMPPNAMYAPPGMQMPPPQAYMPPPPPPPGSYPAPPNGGPRQSMPPTPIPAHAHPYYHSPQLQPAVPYQMMMPPPNAIPPHPYEAGSAPVQMPGHA